jgi:hypothetical protein
MSIRSVVGRANERRRNLPLGVQLLAAFAAGSIVLMSVAFFGPELPGPNVTHLLTGQDDIYGLCDPSQAEVRDPDQPVQEQGRWRREPSIPLGRDELRAASVGGRIFILNGHSSTDAGELTSVSEAQVFDPTNGAYTSAPETPVALDHSAVVAHRGDVYLVGGDSNGHASGGLWRYSPGDDGWRSLPPMETPRAGHAAGVIANRLYVVGGTTDSGFLELEQPPLTSLEIYDFETGQWSRGRDMPTGRHHFSAGVLDGQLYAIGGRTSGDFSLNTVERFDPQRDEWEILPSLPLGTGGHSVETAAGRLVVISGGDDLEEWVTPATWALDAGERRWRRLPDMRVARHGHASATAGDRIYVFGGAPCAGYGQTASVESLSLDRNR